jgi:hypothetical protein
MAALWRCLRRHANLAADAWRVVCESVDRLARVIGATTRRPSSDGTPASAAEPFGLPPSTLSGRPDKLVHQQVDPLLVVRYAEPCALGEGGQAVQGTPERGLGGGGADRVVDGQLADPGAVEEPADDLDRLLESDQCAGVGAGARRRRSACSRLVTNSTVC